MDASAYLSQLLGLLPPGDALVREPGSRLERLFSVPAAELARVDGRVEALLLESDPARTTEMLADWERALGLPDICYPNETFSRASRAWYFDGAGVLREAAVDEPRYLYDATGQRTEAVMLEVAATNFVVQPYYNPTLSGAWVQFGGAATPSITRDYAVAPDGRQTAARVQWAGAGSGATLRVPTSGMPASTTVTVSYYIFARSWGNTTHLVIDVGDGVGTFTPVGSIPLNTQLRLATTMQSGPVAQWIDFAVWAYTTGGVDYDLWGVQLETGDVASSLILPSSPSTIGPTTRAADQRYVATVAERRARILARLIERFEPTPVAIISLAAQLGDTVTLTEFRPHDCEDDADQPLLDDAWAHAFQVAGASSVVVEFTCLDGCETPLSQWRTGAYECAIRRFAPAHTVPIFSYA